MITEIANLEICIGKLQELSQTKKNRDYKLMAKTLMRLIGVLFSDTCVNYFAQLNDRKRTADFERGTGRNDENFYQQVSEAVNDNSCEHHKFLLEYNDSENTYKQYIDDELMDVDIHPSGYAAIQTNTKWIRTTVTNLSKVRNKIKDFMHRSGNGDNDAMSFSENAVKMCKFSTSITSLAAYYFFMQCKLHQEVSSGIDCTLPDYYKRSKFFLRFFCHCFMIH
jgi:hypothetical protein